MVRSTAPEPPPLTIDELVVGIEALLDEGVLDRHLDRLAEALHARRRAQDRQQLGTFRVGDRVRLHDGVRPAYLAGAEGVVTEILHKRVLVRLETPAPGRRGARGDLACPPSVLERLARRPPAQGASVPPRLRALLAPRDQRPR